MAAPDWVDDGVALVAELLRMLVLEETVEGTERVLAPEGEVEEIADGVLLDVKVLEMIVDVGTDPVLEPPREAELATEVEDPSEVEIPAELPPNVEDPPALEMPVDVEDPDGIALAEVEVPEPELPVMPSRVKVPDQPW